MEHPLILSLEQHGEKITIQHPSSHVTYTEFNELLIRLLSSSGYHKEGLLENLKELIEETLNQ